MNLYRNLAFGHRLETGRLPIPPPDYFATFRLPPELLTVPTHDLERFILSQRTYSIFVPLYFGLISLFLILLPFYFGTNLLIFKYEFFKGTGFFVADDRLELSTLGYEPNVLPLHQSAI